MEICTRAISNLPKPGRLFTPYYSRLSWTKNSSKFCFNPGVLQHSISSIRFVQSEETSGFTSQYQFVKAERDDFLSTEDSLSVDQINALDSVQNKALQPEVNYENITTDENAEDNPLSEIQAQLSILLKELDIEYDPENLSTLVALGGGAAVALWMMNAVVGAIDSIPLFPKLMEVIGLGYTLWFSTRYLLLKDTRDELALKIEEIKKQVIGSGRG
ncbi:unnamed protein product [Cuscuta europaea]|uniref:Cyanobacterial aminoacyl-tRNA synthetase CAAD domain-containing protein n=1 Tax=Cuscuta europaea TaxID=41803 RepID=A0A9P1EA37_CUSEU|nr:unnamed protein product [Cuscuta europaea]